MCGIAGFVGPGDRDVLGRMVARLVHRGPDDDGFLIDREGLVHLGFRRLAILDLSDGKQPMSTRDGLLTVIFNGQIYNFRELRDQLNRLGARFMTNHSDTEVLLHGYRQWGCDLPNHLNGMWAFAIFDRARKCLFLSRDRFGKKPLFYFAGENSFAFASELGALQQHPAAPRTLSQRALRKYFAYGYVPAPLTFYEGVHKLPAGHNLTLELSDCVPHVRQYWQYEPEPFEERPANAEDRWSDELAARLEAAVARRLVADVPVGCFLSGGIDSSVVAAMALRRAGRGTLKAFSIGFEEATFDETPYARLVAQHIGADHQIETFAARQMLDLLPDIAARWDEPIADASLLPTFLLCQHARQQVTVALGGDGADELLAGYDPFRALRYAESWARLVPRSVHRCISLIVARLPVSHRYMSFDFRVKRTLRGLTYPSRLWLPIWMAPLMPKELDELLGGTADPEDTFSEAIEAWDSCSSTNPVERAISFYIKLYLQDDILVKVDRASMLNSLEVRAPFLDIDVVDFVRRLPTDMKLRGGTTKYLLRKIAASLLPAEVLRRPKQGFALPIGGWLAEGKLGDPSTVRGARQSFWQDRLQEQRQNVADNRLYLWSEISLANSLVGTVAVDPPYNSYAQDHIDT